MMTLNEICQQYYSKVYRRCLHTLFYNEALAEDITQDVFHELCLQWEQLEKTYIGAWLYKTADHMVLKAKQKYTRSVRKTVALDETYAQNLPAQFDVHEQMQIDKIDANPDLYCALVYDKLKDREKKLLKYLQMNMKYADIAHLMGSTEGAITMAAVRLRRRVEVLVQKLVDDM